MYQAQGRDAVRWFEVDFREVTQRKAAIIQSTPALCQTLGSDPQKCINAGA